MRRTLLATVATVALLATTASAAAAAPENGRAYGNGVKFHCGAPYGQLVQAAKKNPAHPSIKGIGARKFIEFMAAQAVAGDPDGIAEAHGCFQ